MMPGHASAIFENPRLVASAIRAAKNTRRSEGAVLSGDARPRELKLVIRSISATSSVSRIRHGCRHAFCECDGGCRLALNRKNAAVSFLVGI